MKFRSNNSVVVLLIINVVIFPKAAATVCSIIVWISNYLRAKVIFILEPFIRHLRVYCASFKAIKHRDNLFFSIPLIITHKQLSMCFTLFHRQWLLDIIFNPGHKYAKLRFYLRVHFKDSFKVDSFCVLEVTRVDVGPVRISLLLFVFRCDFNRVVLKSYLFFKLALLSDEIRTSTSWRGLTFLSKDEMIAETVESRREIIVLAIRARRRSHYTVLIDLQVGERLLWIEFKLALASWEHLVDRWSTRLTRLEISQRN